MPTVQSVPAMKMSNAPLSGVETKPGLDPLSLNPVPVALLVKAENVATPLTRSACRPENPPLEVKVPAVLVSVTLPLADWGVLPSPSTAFTATGGPLGSRVVPVMSAFTSALAGCVSQTRRQVPRRS